MRDATANLRDPWTAYRLRWKRRRLLWRALRARRRLRPVEDRTDGIARGEILLFAVMRNEATRLPHFLRHYRALGVGHMLIVDNGSSDGTAEALAEQADVSLWSTPDSYKGSRFGLDWLNWLLMLHGHGHWCLTVDADEILIYPHHDQRDLHDLAARLEAAGHRAFGALMLDLYPSGRLGGQTYVAGDDPFDLLRWFDAVGYRAVRQPGLRNLWVQGGVRERCFFANRPRRSPTLNKLPLVKWNRRYAYVNSTHSMLPRRLNLAYDGPDGHAPSGVLLHTKFLPSIVERSAEEKVRRQHFGDPAAFDDYYDGLIDDPVLWSDDSVEFRGWRQLVELGLMSHAGL